MLKFASIEVDMEELVIKDVTSESPEFKDFMNSWGEEIENYFPHYDDEDAGYGEIILLKMNRETIGVFIYIPKGDELHVNVDYVIPKYRNQGIGKEFFKRKIDEFKEIGFSLVVALTPDPDHIIYLKSCGFEGTSKHPHWYELALT